MGQLGRLGRTDDPGENVFVQRSEKKGLFACSIPSLCSRETLRISSWLCKFTSSRARSSSADMASQKRTCQNEASQNKHRKPAGTLSLPSNQIFVKTPISMKGESNRLGWAGMGLWTGVRVFSFLLSLYFTALYIRFT